MRWKTIEHIFRLNSTLDPHGYKYIKKKEKKKLTIFNLWAFFSLWMYMFCRNIISYCLCYIFILCLVTRVVDERTEKKKRNWNCEEMIPMISYIEICVWTLNRHRKFINSIVYYFAYEIRWFNEWQTVRNWEQYFFPSIQIVIKTHCYWSHWLWLNKNKKLKRCFGCICNTHNNCSRIGGKQIAFPTQWS